jgi:pimeloyl-ACP methyl ester carboxylesterase
MARPQRERGAFDSMRIIALPSLRRTHRLQRLAQQTIMVVVSPETRYAKSGEVSIAYQIVGDGPRDLILVPGWMSNIEVFWDEPAVARFLQRLASFSRLILFDKRGTGLSDRLGTLPDLETRMDDVRAVMDAVGSERAALCGYSEGGVMCALFAATYPARTTALITIGSYARQKPGPGYPWGRTLEQQEDFLDAIQKDWGGPVGLDLRAPSIAHDARVRQWWARFLRMSASPTTALALTQMNYEIDVRHVLSAIRVPTLLLHSVGDTAVDVHASRYMAESIAGAKYVEFPSSDHLPWGADADAILDEIEEFLTGSRHGPEPDRILATILFTDIVGSTDRAAELGDRRWRDLLENFYGVVRRELPRFRGVEVSTAGDGVLATFDGPARGIRCARSIADAVLALGLEVRTGLHTGECELIDDNVGGIAVHTASRVAALARPGEVLVSHTVKDLVAGSGIRFESRGTHTLKGVPGEWPLFATIPQARE